MLGYHRSSAYRLFWEGKLKGVKYPMGAVRIYLESVEELLKLGDEI